MRLVKFSTISEFNSLFNSEAMRLAHKDVLRVHYNDLKPMSWDEWYKYFLSNIDGKEKVIYAMLTNDDVKVCSQLQMF